MDDYTVIFTSSTDVTTDIVMNYLPPNQVFRFNFDLFSLYDIVWTPQSLQITDPIGRSINFANVKKAYFRKPVLRKGLPSEEAFAENEKWAAFQSIVCAFWNTKNLYL